MDKLYYEHRNVNFIMIDTGQYIVFMYSYCANETTVFQGDATITNKHENGVDVFTIKDGFLHSYNDEPSMIKHGPKFIKKYWHKNGRIHRETGYAYIGIDKTDESIIEPKFWLNNCLLPIEDFVKLSPISEEEKIILLMNHS